MTGQCEYIELRRPLSSDAPCGESLEDSQLLAGFDAFRLFGQSLPLHPGPLWRDLEVKSRAALERSKDLRLLAHLGAAVLRTEGVPAFLGTLDVAAEWLDRYWTDVYPPIEEDALLRKSAVNLFADPMAICDGLRRQPLVRHALLGSFSLRDYAIATEQLPLPEGEQAMDPAQIRTALATSSVDGVAPLQAAVMVGLEALRRIETTMRERAGPGAAPNFTPLVGLLTDLQHLLTQASADHPQAAGEVATPGDSSVAASAVTAGPGSLQAVHSRQDAIRVLDAVADYFRRSEPSSPIPLFIERAQRLVDKDFLEVLADVAPEALAQARSAGGLREE